MGNWISSWIDQMSYFGVALLMILENVFPPIPSEVVLPLCGFIAGQGKMTFYGVVIAATLGSCLGQIPLYYLGRYLGEGRLKRFVHKHPWLAITPAEMDKAMAWFDKYGSKAVFACRLVPGLRSLISIPAGICGMPLRRFLSFTSLGTVIWTTLLVWAGWLLGDNNELVEKYLHPISNAVVLLILALYLKRVFQRMHRLRKERHDAPGA